MKIFKIRWQLLFTILPISIIPLLIVVLITVNRNFILLENHSSKINFASLTQVASNLDNHYIRYQKILNDLTLMNNFEKLTTISQFKTPFNELAYQATAKNIDATDDENIIWRNTIMGILGDICIIDTGKASLLTKKEYLITYITSNDFIINYDKLVKDPLFLRLKDEKMQMIFGKLQDGVINGFNVENNFVFLYPYYETNTDFSKFILVLLNKEFTNSLYDNITNLNKGTLYILDQFDNIVTTNYPEDTGDLLNNKVVNANKSIKKNIYDLLNADKDIVKFFQFKRFLKELSEDQFDFKRPGYTREDLYNKKFVVTYDNVNYLTLINYSKKAGCKLFFFQPIKQIHKPIYRFLINSVLITAIMILVIILIAFIFSKNLTHSIILLANAARKNIKGGFNFVMIKSRNEIGLLANYFNEMLLKIRDHQIELENTITERTKELQDKNTKLQSLDKLKNDFIANITHDFRSPLMVIMNMADLSMKYDYSREELKNNYELIYNSALRLKITIDKLLELAKMDARGIRLQIKNISIKEFLESITNFYKSVTSGSGVELTLSMPTYEINDFYCDEEKLEQIINNILSNAIKFVEKSTGKIHIALTDDKKNIYLKIMDNGVGIPKDKLISIFNRFEQVDENQSNLKFKGTGIGLAFSRQLMEYLKGEIHAESDGPGHGASFVLRFQRGRNIFHESDFALNELSEGNREEIKKILELIISDKEEENGIQVHIKELNKHNENDIKKCLILIVEDDKRVRKIIFEYLFFAGYQNIIMAADGEKGMTASLKYLPDLIICDYNMPNIRGDEFHDKLIMYPDLRNVPFIFLSALADKNIIIQRKQSGAIAYLQKPIEEREFLVTIELYLKKHLDYKETLSKTLLDDLTGLYNKTEIFRKLRDELHKKQEKGFSLIFFDIDHFKSFNDTYGHQLGDEVLKMMGDVLRSSIKNTDITGRYGGEEFIILLPNTRTNEAVIAAERIQEQIKKQKITYNNEKLFVTASMGIVSLFDNEDYICNKLGITQLDSIFNKDNIIDINELNVLIESLVDLLIHMADQAMYKAKRTTCLNCGFESQKEYDFKNKKCRKCGSSNLEIGRNRIKRFCRD